MVILNQDKDKCINSQMIYSLSVEKITHEGKTDYIIACYSSYDCMNYISLATYGTEEKAKAEIQKLIEKILYSDITFKEQTFEGFQNQSYEMQKRIIKDYIYQMP